MRKVRARPASAGPTVGAAEAIAKISAARAAAFEILMLASEGKGHSDELLHGSRTVGLSPEDHNLATALVMGVLRWQIALDARVGKLLARPGQRLAEPVALALRMGAFQLLHMDRIPDHAALSESVEICRAAGHPHAAGMVNAVLRRAADTKSERRDPTAGSGQALWHSDAGRLEESAADFAERLGHPRWLVERWVKAYGRDAALAICENGQQEPQAGELFADGSADSPQMDDGSRLVAELAAVAIPVREGQVQRVWDCCAAPGGKTLVLAKRLVTAEILATDASAKRMAQMTARLQRYAYAGQVRTAVMDAAGAAGEGGDAGEFDLILCDVPCSGTGTLARNPEIRHRLKVEELARQAERQRAILSGALRRLAPGGRLIYSTCSLEAEENEEVVDAVSGNEFRRIPVGPLIEKLAERGILRREAGAALIGSAVRNGALRTLPGVHGCDGFFAVVLERN